MKVTELSREQLIQLKQAYMTELAGEEDCGEPSWEDLAMVDEMVPDDVIFDNYEGTDFTEEDFTL